MTSWSDNVQKIGKKNELMKIKKCSSVGLRVKKERRMESGGSCEWEVVMINRVSG